MSEHIHSQSSPKAEANMDNGTLRPDFTKYNLVNIETGKIESANLFYQAAQSERNILWARKIKTKLVQV
jgi:hypothetical protein